MGRFIEEGEDDQRVDILTVASASAAPGLVAWVGSVLSGAAVLLAAAGHRVARGPDREIAESPGRVGKRCRVAMRAAQVFGIRFGRGIMRSRLDEEAAMADVQGTCDSRFDGLRAALARNIDADEELGASLVVDVGGDVVVDLWGATAILRGPSLRRAAVASRSRRARRTHSQQRT